MAALWPPMEAVVAVGVFLEAAATSAGPLTALWHRADGGLMIPWLMAGAASAGALTPPLLRAAVEVAAAALGPSRLLAADAATEVL